MKLSRLIRFAVLLCVIFMALPQDYFSQRRDSSFFSIHAKFHYSYVFIHAKDLIPDDNYFPRGIEIDLNRTHADQKSWDQCNCYPSTGLSIIFYDYDMPKVLGYGVTAAWYVEPQFRAHKKLSFTTRGSAGFSYLTRPYHPVKNPANQAYSMPLAAFISLDFGLRYRWTEKLFSSLALNLNHNSNGGLKDPNKGLNFPSLSLGVNYFPSSPQLNKRERTGYNKQARNVSIVEAGLFSSNRSISHGEKKRYFINGVYATISKRVSRISAVGFGAEFWLDHALREKLLRHGYDRNFHRAGILFGHEFLIGKFSFSQQVGLYVLNPAKFSDWYLRYHDAIYQRYGIKYRLSKHFTLGGNMKVDRYIANFADVRAAWVF